MSPDGKALYALLQSATIQDGGSRKSNARYTRPITYDISQASTTRLVSEWVVPLPLDSSDKTLGASELPYVSNGVFFVLPVTVIDTPEMRRCRHTNLISTSGATDFHGTKSDSPSHPIGVLSSRIVPAQLARFGLHNDTHFDDHMIRSTSSTERFESGDLWDQTLIDAKWESFALTLCPKLRHEAIISFSRR